MAPKRSVKAPVSFITGSFAAIVALATLGFEANFAQAQGVDSMGSWGTTERVEYPQVGALDLRFGTYPLRVDEEFNGAATPGANSFGGGTTFHVGIEFDWQLLRIPKVGSLGPGIGVGYSTFEGQSVDASGQPVDETNSLNILPIHAVAVFRWDTLVRETDIPLEFWAKLGAASGIWWTSTPLGTSQYDGRSGDGISWGPWMGIGVGLALEFLDRRSGAMMHNTVGVNHTYLFFEWDYSDLSNFGQRMQVGTNAWVTGLSFEF